MEDYIGSNNEQIKDDTNLLKTNKDENKMAEFSFYIHGVRALHQSNYEGKMILICQDVSQNKKKQNLKILRN